VASEKESDGDGYDEEEEDEEEEEEEEEYDDAMDGDSDSDSEETNSEARAVRNKIMRDLCAEYKAYAAFTREEVGWAMRVITRVDEQTILRGMGALVSRDGAGTLANHDAEGMRKCVFHVTHLMDSDFVGSLYTIGELGGLPMAFRRVETVKRLFATLLIANEKDLFKRFDEEVVQKTLAGDIDTPNIHIPGDVIDQCIIPNIVPFVVDLERQRAIAEGAWSPVRDRLTQLARNDEKERVVRRYVGGAIAALVFAKRDGFDFDVIGWTPKARVARDPCDRPTSTPVYGASKTAPPSTDIRRVRLLLYSGAVDDNHYMCKRAVVYVHVPLEFAMEDIVEHAKTTYDDVARFMIRDTTEYVPCWDHPYLIGGGSLRDPILARGPVRVQYGDRITIRALPLPLLVAKGKIPIDFEEVRASVPGQIERLIAANLENDPKAGACDTVSVEFGFPGWNRTLVLKGNSSANPAKKGVVESRLKKIATLKKIAIRLTTKKFLDIAARRASPPTAIVVKKIVNATHPYVKIFRSYD
ncbi:MAG: hypothetical protein QMC37_09310, partial [Flavobacteriales bacterium]